MSFVRFISSFLLILATAVHALSSSSSTRILLPTLDNLASQLSGTQLTFQVAVGDEESPFQMQGPSIRLQSDEMKRDSDAPKTGSAYSTGLYETATLEDPYYINIKGKQGVDLQNSAWQVCWGKRAPFGFLVCSFEAPTALRRTAQGAELEEGRFFLYHRMWTAQTLEIERMRRQVIQQRAGKYLGDRDKLVKKLQEEEEQSVWNKLKTYGQAYSAANKFRDSGMRGAKFTPLYDDQVLIVSSDCILSTRGRVFRKAEWQRDFMVREEDLLYLGEDNGKEMAYIGECRVDFSKK